MTYGVTPFQSINNFITKVSAITNRQHVIDIDDVGEPHLTHTIQVYYICISIYLYVLTYKRIYSFIWVDMSLVRICSM